MQEVYRVLAPGGSFMLITGYDPKDLMKIFAKHPWSVEHSVVKGRDDATAHLYIASKVADVSVIDSDDDEEYDYMYDQEDTGLVTGMQNRGGGSVHMDTF